MEATPDRDPEERLSFVTMPKVAFRKERSLHGCLTLNLGTAHLESCKVESCGLPPAVDSTSSPAVCTADCVALTLIQQH